MAFIALHVIRLPLISGRAREKAAVLLSLIDCMSRNTLPHLVETERDVASQACGAAQLVCPFSLFFSDSTTFRIKSFIAGLIPPGQ